MNACVCVQKNTKKNKVSEKCHFYLCPLREQLLVFFYSCAFHRQFDLYFVYVLVFHFHLFKNENEINLKSSFQVC